MKKDLAAASIQMNEFFSLEMCTAFWYLMEITNQWQCGWPYLEYQTRKLILFQSLMNITAPGGNFRPRLPGKMTT